MRRYDVSQLALSVLTSRDYPRMQVGRFPLTSQAIVACYRPGGKNTH
jgi:hypothetical protein